MELLLPFSSYSTSMTFSIVFLVIDVFGVNFLCASLERRPLAKLCTSSSENVRPPAQQIRGSSVLIFILILFQQCCSVPWHKYTEIISQWHQWVICCYAVWNQNSPCVRNMKIFPCLALCSAQCTWEPQFLPLGAYCGIVSKNVPPPSKLGVFVLNCLYVFERVKLHLFTRYANHAWYWLSWPNEWIKKRMNTWISERMIEWKNYGVVMSCLLREHDVPQRSL